MKGIWFVLCVFLAFAFGLIIFADVDDNQIPKGFEWLKKAPVHTSEKVNPLDSKDSFFIPASELSGWEVQRAGKITEVRRVADSGGMLLQNQIAAPRLVFSCIEGSLYARIEPVNSLVEKEQYSLVDNLQLKQTWVTDARSGHIYSSQAKNLKSSMGLIQRFEITLPYKLKMDKLTFNSAGLVKAFEFVPYACH